MTRRVRRHSLLRALLPMALLAVGVWLLSGCVYVPMFGRPLVNRNVARDVGDERSGKRVRINRSSHDDVIEVLGRAYDQSSDNRSLTYSWSTRNGVTIWPLCFEVDGIDRQHFLRLQFDEKGILRSQRRWHEDDPAIDPEIAFKWAYPREE